MVISVTQAARKFADCVNRVHYQGASFILHKNGVAVARIVPVEFGYGNELEQRAVASDVRHEVLESEKETAAMLPEDEEQARNLQPPALPKRPVLNW
jgi:antitoxin (DNA-binding transcriptional repressor) of toxin-antitoxin stability system